MSDAGSQAGPFKTREVRERSFFARLAGTSKPNEAQAAIESLIAERGLDHVDIVAVDNILHNFRVQGDAAASVLLAVWRHALQTFVETDGQLDGTEAGFLGRLKIVLGLDESQASSEQRRILESEFVARAGRLLSRADATSDEVRLAVSTLARQLRVSSDRHKALLKKLAQAAFSSIIQQQLAARRSSAGEINALVAFKEEYGVDFAGDERNRIVRCYHLALLDEGTLPEQAIDVSLDSSETCHFGAYAILMETRKTRQGGVSYDMLKQIDQGGLYLTDRRLLFVGNAASKTIRFSSLARAYQESGALVIQRTSGKTQTFVFNNDLDVEAAARILEQKCESKGTARATGAIPTRKTTERHPPSSESKAANRSAEMKEATATLPSLLAELDALTGLEAVKKEVRSLVNYLRVQRLRLEQGLPTGVMTVHLVFTGNPGTGKTTVARLLAKLYQAIGFLPTGQLVEIDRGGLVAGYLGQTALKTTETINKALGGVLFIDEAYALARSGKGQEGDSFGQEAIDTLLKAMEDNRDQLVVIVAGYREPMKRFLQSNPGLQSRFTRYIDFPDYSPEELLEIFNKLSSKEGYTVGADASERARVLFETAYAQRGERFGNGRFARTVFERACVKLSDRLAHDLDITRDELTTLHAADIELPADGRA